MIIIEKRAAIKVFYYLMAIDDSVSAEELQCFDTIGNELDPENFPVYRDTSYYT